MARGRKTGGRKKGTPNKFNADLRSMILAALHEAGGQDYLLKQALENSTSFNGLLGRVLPLQVQGDEDKPLRAKMEVVFVRPSG